MKFSATPVVVALIAGANAASIPRAQGPVSITFEGAAGAQFSQSFPTDGSRTNINNPLSISHITSGNAGVSCSFHGVDNGVTVTRGAQTVDVGPPQTQTWGACRVGSNPPSRRSDDQVAVTFIGAADAQFTQYFPVNGDETQIYNRLSISHIASSTAGVSCTFNGIDDSVTTVTGAQTVDVGPPQTQISGSCHSV
ncbi:hypothetical protein BDV25DRAFT_154289 [Aspergillus avenaceus]|uniref:Uncharacterized protein n=1 Tax=Aspergillus avenaceus TaxID=36643 RepID=A0A5N6TWM7_ASPAV|nr:hypothetical protein BDV25DRAFT_154289 [Aspergillus avenaceus]